MRPLRFVCLATVLACFTAAPAREPQSRVEAIEIVGEKLRGNPLGDPIARKAAVIAPDDLAPGRPAPIIYYLPGWGGSSEEFLAAGATSPFAQLVRSLAARGLPLRIVAVDGRSRWGGSQFLNSAATGNYADYVADEIVPTIEKRFALEKGRRLIAGHSSGGYGALMLAMERHALFDAVIGLSPDSDFENTHKALVSQPAVRRVTPSMLDAWLPPTKAQPEDGLVRLICGLCANYAPLGPGRFEWLYDEQGQWRPKAWQRWLDHDPITHVTKNRDAFAATQRVYLDGAEQDEYGANIGARHIYEVLRDRATPVTFYESPGHHSEHLTERLDRGISWVFEHPVVPIPR